jgi:hypothetical protein
MGQVVVLLETTWEHSKGPIETKERTREGLIEGRSENMERGGMQQKKKWGWGEMKKERKGFQ